MTYGELHKYLKAYNKKAAAEGRPFEDLFSEYQSEMIRQSIAYADGILHPTARMLSAQK